MEEHVGGVWPVGQISNLVDHQHVRVRVSCQRLLEMSLLAGVREILNEFRRGGEERLEAILNRAISDGYCQMGFATAGLAVKNQRAPFGYKSGPR
jgi:hypothetical protein